MQKLGQPLVLGYILTGIAFSPYTGGFALSSVHEIELLAEIESRFCFSRWVWSFHSKTLSLSKKLLLSEHRFK